MKRYVATVIIILFILSFCMVNVALAEDKQCRVVYLQKLTGVETTTDWLSKKAAKRLKKELERQENTTGHHLECKDK